MDDEGRGGLKTHGRQLKTWSFDSSGSDFELNLGYEQKLSSETDIALAPDLEAGLHSDPADYYLSGGMDSGQSESSNSMSTISLENAI